MPLEIKELHIKVTVNTEAGQAAPTAGESAGGGGGNAGGAGMDQDSLIATCVEQVLEILAEKMEP